MEAAYLIHTRECFKLDEEIYKLGRSHDIDNRVRQYAKGSKILCLISCNNSIQCEKELIALFRIHFKHAKEYGHEYFEGSKELMMKMMHEFFLENLNKKILKEKSLVKDKDVKKVKEIKEIKEIKDIKENKEIKKIKEVKDVKNSKDRTCPKCKLKFKFPSVLKLHVKTVFHCLTSEEDIEKYITENTVPKEIINNTIIKCNNCKLTFTQQSSLNRHNKESKCAEKVKENESKKTSEEYIIQIKNLDPNLAKKIETLFKKEK
jgi:hypothetical protein